MYDSGRRVGTRWCHSFSLEGDSPTTTASSGFTRATASNNASGLIGEPEADDFTALVLR
jgi:hypothetical protein